MTPVRPIRRLSQAVVDRIGASEVIQRPKNVVKELIENSLDAGSTSITVVIKFSATNFDLIEVRDNGGGIGKNDMELACERFSTSKLETFDDLKTMATFGFRGEALASMSHVARVTILSKTENSLAGYELKYLDGIPTPIGAKPSAKAANRGTVITVEDLFHNVPMRKNALKNHPDEYRLINELVSQYAIDNLHVAFVLKKEGSSATVQTAANRSLAASIATLFGIKNVASLVPITFNEEGRLKVFASGVVGDFSSSLKSYIFVLFINKRLVDCSPLRKAIETIYKSHTAKGSCAFVYLSLLIDAQNVDVNVHPTKNEVRFLNEDEIIEELVKHIESKLMSHGPVRVDPARSKSPNGPPSNSSSSTSTLTKRPSTVVRTSHESQRVDVMFERQMSTQVAGKNSHRRVVRLMSILELRKEVKEKTVKDYRTILIESTFVGCRRSVFPACFVQHKTQLLHLNLTLLSNELFYQECLDDFSNFGQIELSTGLSIKELASIYFDGIGMFNGDKEFEATRIANQIIDNRSMLDDYFAIVVDGSGMLTGLPVIVDGYIPDMMKLPAFVKDLSDTVDWKTEIGALSSICKVIAKFYELSWSGGGDNEFRSFNKTVEFIIYPLIKKKLCPSAQQKSAFGYLSDVSTLYKVFHRC